MPSPTHEDHPHTSRPAHPFDSPTTPHHPETGPTIGPGSSGFRWPPAGGDIDPPDAGGRTWRWPAARDESLFASGESVDTPAVGAGGSRGGGPGSPRSAGVWGSCERAWLGVTSGPIELEDRTPGCPRCGESVGELGVGVDGSCPACRGRSLAWERLIRVGEYRGVLKQAVRETKFRAFRARGVEMGRLLGANVAAAMAGAGIGAHETLIVPVPMHWATRVWRGVDHTLAIARGVERETGARVWKCLRRRWGPDQVGVPRSRRWANIRDAFRACGPGPRRANVRAVVVVDDVKTTGSTLKAAIRALRVAWGAGNVRFLDGVSVWAGVVAVAGGGAARTRLGSGA